MHTVHCCIREVDNEMALKMDRRLLAAIRERSGRGLFPVTIELRHAVRPVTDGSRANTMKKLKDRLHRHHSDVINLLTSMEVQDIQILSLSNSIKTRLTADQIEKVADHPDVKIVRLIRADKLIM